MHEQKKKKQALKESMNIIVKKGGAELLCKSF